MTKTNDLVGKQFGRLTVLSRDGSNQRGRALWLCKCSCGTEKTLLGDHLTRRDNKGVLSCGCLQQENRTTHGAYAPDADIRYHIKYSLLQSLKDRARRHGYQSDLDCDDMPQIPDNCPVLKSPLLLFRKWESGKGKGKGRNRHDSAPTIDRHNPNLPYLRKYKDNLFVISWRANKLKSNGTLKEFEGIVEYMRHGGTLEECESSLIDSNPIKISAGNEAQVANATA